MEHDIDRELVAINERHLWSSPW